MFGTSFKVSYFVLIIALVVTFYYRNPESELQRIHLIKEELLNIENFNKVNTGYLQPRVAVGYVACHDMFVNATMFLNYMQYTDPPQHIDDLSTEEKLLQSFAYYFKHGAATELFMSNTELYDELVKRAEKLPDSRWSLGGNAPLMATRFYLEGWKVMLAAKMSQTLKEYIPSEIVLVGDDKVVKDDVHMILEYRSGEVWGQFTAPRANRYILHNDEHNPLVSSLEFLETELPSFEPHLLVVSGLQMMDSYPFEEGLREERLNKIKNQIINLPYTTLVHFEMASYVEVTLLDNLVNLILPHVDSIGMNEQELANLYSMLQHGNVSFVSDCNPRVALALDQMRQVFKMTQAKSTQINSSKKLSRIHVHTLAYQAILTVKGSKWKRTKAATAKASLTAHRYVCNTDNIILEKTRLVMDDSFCTTTHQSDSRITLDPAQPVSCWDETLDGVDVEICVAPVLVCTEAQLTAGAGDNISAAGLVLQVHD